MGIYQQHRQQPSHTPSTTNTHNKHTNTITDNHIPTTNHNKPPTITTHTLPTHNTHNTTHLLPHTQHPNTTHSLTPHQYPLPSLRNTGTAIWLCVMIFEYSNIMLEVKGQASHSDIGNNVTRLTLEIVELATD